MGVQEGAPYEVKETQLLVLQEASEASPQAVLHPASWHVFLSYFFISPSFIQFWENTKVRVNKGLTQQAWVVQMLPTSKKFGH